MEIATRLCSGFVVPGPGAVQLGWQALPWIDTIQIYTLSEMLQGMQHIYDTTVKKSCVAGDSGYLYAGSAWNSPRRWSPCYVASLLLLYAFFLLSTSDLLILI